MREHQDREREVPINSKLYIYEITIPNSHFTGDRRFLEANTQLQHKIHTFIKTIPTHVGVSTLK